jgi:predicted HNH restriction endonuclease
MSRKQFIQKSKASCKNWQNSWSFVNHEDRFVIFGDWQNRHQGLIFSEDWVSRKTGRRTPGYKESRANIQLVEEDGYKLFVFPMYAEDPDAESPRIHHIDERLFERTLVRDQDGRNWYAVGDPIPPDPDKSDSTEAENSTNWSKEELKASVETYLLIQKRLRAGEDFTKKSYYLLLADQFGRSLKSIEYRMQNISYVLSLHGREWIQGLAPAKNVGTNVAAEIESLLAKAEGRAAVPAIAFEASVETQLKRKEIQPPTGVAVPKRVTSSSSGFERDPEVKAWVLINAQGICESCEQPAPFTSVTGHPFLEVHHVRPLADEGSDKIENAVAICPNCHRAFHHSREKESLILSLFSRIKRLVKE